MARILANLVQQVLTRGQCIVHVVIVTVNSLQILDLLYLNLRTSQEIDVAPRMGFGKRDLRCSCAV